MKLKDKIEIVQADITTLRVDAIVNAANNDLILGGGVAGAIRRAGGESIQDECNEIGTIAIGTAAITGAGSLPAKHVIHAASMALGERTEEPGLRNATREALSLARDASVKTIAFPAIGTGVAMFPIDRCAKVMLEEMVEHLSGKTTIEKITFALFDGRSVEAFTEALDEAVAND